MNADTTVTKNRIGLKMDNRHQRYHHSKPVIVRLNQWHGKEESGQCEQSSQLISDNSLLDRPLLANVENYLKSGVVLLDIEESDLQTITLRVAEQVR